MSKYRWVWHEGEKLYDVGIRADGTLHNPRGYPDEVVRTAVMAADARKRERRSDAAKQAAQTRHTASGCAFIGSPSASSPGRPSVRAAAASCAGSSSPTGRASTVASDRSACRACWRRSRGRAAAKANPMVNSGAIATTSLVAGASAEDR